MSRYDPDKHRRRSIRLRGYDYTQSGAYFVTIVTQDREPLFGDVIDGGMVLNVYGRVAATMWQRIPRHFPHVELDEWVVMPNHIHGIIVIGRGDAFPVKHPDDTGSAHGELSTASRMPDGECVALTGRTIPVKHPDDTGSAHGELSTASRMPDGECVALTGRTIPVKHPDDTGSAHGELSTAARMPDGECVAPTGPPSGSLGAIVGNFKSVVTRRINRMRKTPGARVWQRNYYERIIRNERELNAIRQYIHDNPAHWRNDTENPVA